VHEPDYKVVDTLLVEEIIPDDFAMRMLGGEFGAAMAMARMEGQSTKAPGLASPTPTWRGAQFPSGAGLAPD
jgi:hypothetical protein